MFRIIFGFFTGLPPKTWLAILAVLSVLGAFFWFKHSIYVECQSDEQAKQNQAEIAALEQKLADLKQYQEFLLDKQSKNQKTIEQLKKDVENAQDGDVAPVLHNALDGLRRAREEFDK